MTTERTLDVSGLPEFAVSSQAPLWWGQACLAAIEATTFAILIAMYFYYRLSVDMWPPAGVQLPHVELPTVALLPLIASVVASYIASEGAKKNDRRTMLRGLTANAVLVLAFLALRFIEWQTLNFRWDTDVHGSIFYAILFLHSLDVVADLVYTLVLIVVIWPGNYGGMQRVGVHVDSLVWYFLAAIWIPLYVVIYWGPHIVGAPK